MDITYSSRVVVKGERNKNSIFTAHGELAESMVATDKAHISDGALRRAKRGKAVFIKEIFILDVADNSKEPSSNRNSSKTTYAEPVRIRRYNERGELRREPTLAALHQHKKIPKHVADMYGRKPL